MRQPPEVTAFLDILILLESPATEGLNHDAFIFSLLNKVKF